MINLYATRWGYLAYLLEPARKTADKKNSGQARHSATKKANKKDGG